ncbi:hypothetical protein B0T25DRAFT_562686 [Lasiosphaeria hispida]|uniref:Uncharacterized protein n=1 Tax=Lasiosphaeria hispida TaxID=260671 RepID=A0AAJ0HVZ2_9PEZI|nr:hypothetical protein B0T25DRAFT_562686 [Lasiosphaeria hispida]
MEILPTPLDLAEAEGPKHHDPDLAGGQGWEHHGPDLIFVHGSSTDCSLADQIIRLIDDAHDHDQRIPSFRFLWPPDQAGSVLSELLLKLDRIGLRNAARFEYDYQSHIAFLDMSEAGETRGHSVAGWEVNTVLNTESQRAVLNIDNAAIREQAKRIICFNTASIHLEGKLYKIPDGSFGSIHEKASFVFEVS